MRWNLLIGIPDFAFVIIYEGIVQAIADTLLFISMSAFFARLVPTLIEGSSFALYSGTFRLTYGIFSPLLAIFLNFEMVTPSIQNSNIDQFSKLAKISLILQPFGLLAMQIIPTWE